MVEVVLNFTSPFIKNQQTVLIQSFLIKDHFHRCPILALLSKDHLAFEATSEIIDFLATEDTCGCDGGFLSVAVNYSQKTDMRGMIVYCIRKENREREDKGGNERKEKEEKCWAHLVQVNRCEWKDGKGTSDCQAVEMPNCLSKAVT
jgi:hypothetical protein